MSFTTDNMSAYGLFSFIKKAIHPSLDQKIAKLQEMGFDSNKIEKYINKYDGDMDLVLEHLILNKQRRTTKKRLSTDTKDHPHEITKQNGETLHKLQSKPDEINVHCKCGAKMKLIQPQQCKISIGLTCNNKKCCKQMKQSEWFYHCMENSSNPLIHKGPYNYCTKCAELKILLIEREQKSNEYTAPDIYSILNKVKLPKFEFLKHNPTQISMEERYGLSSDQMMLLYLIPDEMHKHIVVWIKSTGANSTLLSEYSEICKELFGDIDQSTFPIFTVFGCNSIEFDTMAIPQKYALQRILIILATYHVSLTYCPQIVHLIYVLLHKMDEKCVFALCHSMLNASNTSNDKNMYFTFNYLNHSVRIQTLLSLIENNVKNVDRHLKENDIDIRELITNAMESMFIEYLTQDTYFTLMDKFFEKGYQIVLKIAVSFIKNCQKYLLQTTNVSQFENALKQYGSSITPHHLNSWSFMANILWNIDNHNNTFEELENQHKNDRYNYLNEYIPPNIIRIWPKWDLQRMNELKTQIFSSKWMFYQVWSWLPSQCHLGEYRLLFNTETMGYKLMSLYYFSINHSNLLLFIKTQIGEIFGAFISTIGYEQHWKNFLSDHRAFLFVLKSNDEMMQKIEYNNQLLSVLPTKDSLSIGYDKCNLIYVDEALKTGFCATCSTSNKSLCSQPNGQFDVASIEVWSVEHDFQVPIKAQESIHSLCQDHLLRLSNVLFGGRQYTHSEYASL